jgi:hypothetical protein
VNALGSIPCNASNFIHIFTRSDIWHKRSKNTHHHIPSQKTLVRYHRHKPHEPSLTYRQPAPPLLAHEKFVKFLIKSTSKIIGFVLITVIYQQNRRK